MRPWRFRSMGDPSLKTRGGLLMGCSVRTSEGALATDRLSPTCRDAEWVKGARFKSRISPGFPVNCSEAEELGLMSLWPTFFGLTAVVLAGFVGFRGQLWSARTAGP